MGQIITNPKTYSGQELETIFFRPMLVGKSAAELGLRVMYNMPVPTTLDLWARTGDAISEYADGWKGGAGATKYQKKIDVVKCKSEMGIKASDYSAMIQALISQNGSVSLQDLTGTDVENAEVTLFKQNLMESLRATMWLGNTERTTGGYKTFDGLVKKCDKYAGVIRVTGLDVSAPSKAVAALKAMWAKATPELRAQKDSGTLKFYVTSDVKDAYEQYLDEKSCDGAYADVQNGRRMLNYHGIEIVDVQVGSYTATLTDLPASFIILTDKNNLVFAVNTANMPDADVRLWYNPDMNENRARAAFLAGAEIIDEAQVVFYTSAAE